MTTLRELSTTLAWVLIAILLTPAIACLVAAMVAVAVAFAALIAVAVPVLLIMYLTDAEDLETDEGDTQ